MEQQQQQQLLTVDEIIEVYCTQKIIILTTENMEVIRDLLNAMDIELIIYSPIYSIANKILSLNANYNKNLEESICKKWLTMISWIQNKIVEINKKHNEFNYSRNFCGEYKNKKIERDEFYTILYSSLLSKHTIKYLKKMYNPNKLLPDNWLIKYDPDFNEEKKYISEFRNDIDIDTEIGWFISTTPK